MLLAARSGLYLYQSKHQALMLDRDITKTLNAVDTARQRSGLLRAEYALLNDPSRLARSSAAFPAGNKADTAGQVPRPRGSEQATARDRPAAGAARRSAGTR